jgi:hypothetical protein
MGGHDLFFYRWTHCLISVTKVPEMRMSILLLQIDIGAIYNLKLRTKLNAKFPWPPIMPKKRECILNLRICPLIYVILHHHFH